MTRAASSAMGRRMLQMMPRSRCPIDSHLKSCEHLDTMHHLVISVSAFEHRDRRENTTLVAWDIDDGFVCFDFFSESHDEIVCPTVAMQSLSFVFIELEFSISVLLIYFCSGPFQFSLFFRFSATVSFPFSVKRQLHIFYLLIFFIFCFVWISLA